jgi:hypothetical protein
VEARSATRLYRQHTYPLAARQSFASLQERIQDERQIKKDERLIFRVERVAVCARTDPCGETVATSIASPSGRPTVGGQRRSRHFSV